jgi:hypothetical protein
VYLSPYSLTVLRFFCGEGGIRTPGSVKIASFQDWCIRPLCHLSYTREPDRIRTCDRLLRRQMLYPAELRVRVFVCSELSTTTDFIFEGLHLSSAHQGPYLRQSVDCTLRSLRLTPLLCAPGRGRTGTDITVHRILSPACLPIPPPGHILTFFFLKLNSFFLEVSFY